MKGLQEISNRIISEWFRWSTPYFINIHFNNVKVFQMVSPLQVLRSKLCVHLSSPPRMLCVLPHFILHSILCKWHERRKQRTAGICTECMIIRDRRGCMIIKNNIVVGYPTVRKFQTMAPMKNNSVCARRLNQWQNNKQDRLFWRQNSHECKLTAPTEAQLPFMGH
jgi:hypothetical protein